MLFIKRKETDPYFNIAAEEYILKNFTEEYFMLWRNQPSVIIGKHQNTLAEINRDFIQQNNIPVIRRITGGGTVYHDLGNLNFTFIKNASSEKLIDFKKFTDPIINALASLSVKAKFENNNNLTVEGKKISGNAEHVYKNRVLHHGTLLFSTNLNNLTEALKVGSIKFTSKAVNSIQSKVTNIVEHLLTPISIEEFETTIYENIKNSDANAQLYEFSATDIKNINKLVKEKYATWKWNFAYSPKYNFNKSINTSNGNIEFNIDVKDGSFTKVEINSNFMNKKTTNELKSILIGAAHNQKEIKDVLKKFNFENHFKNISLNEFIQGMF